VLHAIEVAFEAQPERIGRFDAPTRPGTERARRARGEHHVERSLTVFARPQRPADEGGRIGMRASNLLHTSTVPGG
jgi:hypothetical protein